MRDGITLVGNGSIQCIVQRIDLEADVLIHGLGRLPMLLLLTMVQCAAETGLFRAESLDSLKADCHRKRGSAVARRLSTNK